MKHVGMSQSATPATRNEATRRLKPPKVTTVAKLATGTAIATSRGRLQTVANGCATSGEHSLDPQTSRVKREPLLRLGKNDRLGFKVLQASIRDAEPFRNLN